MSKQTFLPTTSYSLTKGLILTTTTGLLVETRAVDATQMREMNALVAAATACNTPAPPRKEGQAQAQAQIHMNLAVTLRVRYHPPRGVKTTGVDRNGRAVRTCRHCTKNWVTHAEADCLELATKSGMGILIHIG